jgi:thiol-disulfide isomerase/thioredoxin
MTQLARRLVMVALLGGLVFWVSGPAPAEPANGPTGIRAEKIKYAELCNLVRANKGKVVVVDFWATYCPPCIAKFPHLVQMSNQYKNDSLVAVSVSVDDPGDAQIAEKVHTFLKNKNADRVTNLLLDEKGELWKERLGIDGPPCVYVFNQDGRIAGKWPDAKGQVDYDEIEKKVAELMKK